MIEIERDRYKPLRDYAAIGDCHGHALVAMNGDIDWCCLERHDQDPVFCRVLDADKGGVFSLRPKGAYEATRRYVSGTNLLLTTFRAAAGTAELLDFMPVGRRVNSGPHDYVNLIVPGWIVRRLRVVEGEMAFELRYRPTPGFAARNAELEPVAGGVGGEDLPTLFCSKPLVTADGEARGDIALRVGERFDAVLAARYTIEDKPLERLDRMEAVTKAFWREWIGYCRYDGPYEEAVKRSALALKLLTFAPSGAVVAALTSSLPEAIGGGRNWDYRYSWLRDSCFALYALAALGYSGEAGRYVTYLTRCVRLTLPNIQIMYGIQRERFLPEETLDHLEGYAGSAPVRRGNGAFDQRQIDVYGQVLDLALLYEALGGRLDEQDRRLFRTFVDVALSQWCQPDYGLWEMRGPNLHHVHGKLMAWVAVDRAIKLYGTNERWERLRETIRARIESEGTNAEGALVQAFGRDASDAAVLLAPALGFPLKDGMLEATLKRVDADLRHGPYLHRYQGDDGLEGGEGAFLICSFWLVDALLAAGRGDEAKALFEKLVAGANDVGLYAEEIDPESGAFLGNMPQAFTHLALIGSAVNLELYAKEGRAALKGTYADRAGRAVGATFGLKGLFAAFRQKGTIHRLTSSDASIMLWP